MHLFAKNVHCALHSSEFANVMKADSLFALGVLTLFSVGYAPAADRFITLNNEPVGTLEEPLLLLTYLPDPGLGR